MAAAMTDRITYKSYMVDMNGDSYRMKETKKMAKGVMNHKDFNLHFYHILRADFLVVFWLPCNV